MELINQKKDLYVREPNKKKVRIVSISFPERDLSLSVVSLKNYAMKDKRVANKYLISISQFFITTSNDKIFTNLASEYEDFYCFSTYVWNITKILDVAKRLKKTNPKTSIVLGGPEASGMAETLLLQNDFVDFIIADEGEAAFKEFLMSNHLRKVPNLVYRRDNSIVSNPRNPLVDLDELPLPYESDDYRKYLDDSPKPVRAAIETSRGCPLSCAYCSWGTKKMRYFSLEKLKPSFEYLFNHPNVATVYITDSNPFLNKKRAKELLTLIIKKNIEKKPTIFELNPESITDDGLLNLISRVNEEEFAFGVQSTSPAVLQKIGRTFNSERYRRNINLIKKLNPRVRMYFSLIIGLPGDNYQQFLETLDFVLNLIPDGIYAHELLCLPGSKIYQNPDRYGIEFMKTPPHKVLRNDTFCSREYSSAKNLSYHVSLIHRMPSLRDDIFKLYKSQENMNLVDFYERFVNFISGKIDTLSGKRIHDVSSWFFEQYATNFIEENQNVMDLLSLYETFKKNFTTQAGDKKC